MKKTALKLRNELVAPGLFLFMKELVANPFRIGAPSPSSKELARAMSQEVPWPINSKIVELGAGTGAITQALLERGIPPEQIIMVERSAIFASHLRNQFPTSEVLQGDARKLSQLIQADQSIDVIVSSLPLRSMPPATVAAIIQQMQLILKPGGLLIQFTYFPLRKFSLLKENFSLVSNLHVWANFPPARVEVYRYRG